MVILGVDPGTLITGYGVIESRNGRVQMLVCDAVKNDSRRKMPDRLKVIFERLTRIIEQYHPDELALETAFYGKNAQSALKLGHARGAAMLAAVVLDVPTTEYSPREVKKAVVGTGAASKEQVQYMVKSMLRMKTTPKHYDTTDALAVALCHLNRRTRHRGRFRDWKSFVKANPDKIRS
jgi:crossover junction endodeoxyribonuclease RuvC